MFKSNSILLAACGGSALLALSCGSVASAAVIYSDSLTEYTAGNNINGDVPGPAGNTNAWLAPATRSSNAYWKTGSSGAYTVNGTTGPSNALLAFTPVAGNIYTLQATVSVAGNTSNWAALGFLSSDAAPTDTNNFYNASDGWMMARGANGGADQTFIGPGLNGGNNATTFGNNDSVTMTLTLTTNASSPWTIGYQYTDLGNSSNDSTYSPVAYAVGHNPTNIAAVGFGEFYATSTVTNFSLTATPIPEPASLGLTAIGALGLLLLKRRRVV